MGYKTYDYENTNLKDDHRDYQSSKASVRSKVKNLAETNADLYNKVDEPNVDFNGGK